MSVGLSVLFVNSKTNSIIAKQKTGLIDVIIFHTWMVDDPELLILSFMDKLTVSSVYR